MYIRKKGKKLVQSKKTEIDGIKFQSMLEAYMYKALKVAKLDAVYEGEEFILVEGFNFNVNCYERTTIKPMENRGNNNILPIKYTPDFIGNGFIIECKGRANESFPMRWKLFKKWIVNNRPNVVLFKPQSQKDCDEVISILLKKR